MVDIESFLNLLSDKIGQEELFKIQEFHEPFSDILAQEAEMWYGDKIKEIGRDMEEMILNLEEEILNERLILLQDIINKGGGGDYDLSQTLKDYQKTVERIGHIKSHRSK